MLIQNSNAQDESRTPLSAFCVTWFKLLSRRPTSESSYSRRIRITKQKSNKKERTREKTYVRNSPVEYAHCAFTLKNLHRYSWYHFDTHVPSHSTILSFLPFAQCIVSYDWIFLFICIHSHLHTSFGGNSASRSLGTEREGRGGPSTLRAKHGLRK